MEHILLPTRVETQSFGQALGRLLQAGDLVALIGDLGAGKTTLTQGIAQGMGIVEPVTSPTFTLVQEYSLREMTNRAGGGPESDTKDAGKKGADKKESGRKKAEKQTSLFHFDPYRLENPEEVYDFGFDEYLEREGVLVVEWADKIASLLPTTRLTLTLRAAQAEASAAKTDQGTNFYVEFGRRRYGPHSGN